MKLGYHPPEAPTTFIEASAPALGMKMRNAPDEATRKACYEGLLTIGPTIINDFVEIIKLRGRLAVCTCVSRIHTCRHITTATRARVYTSAFSPYYCLTTRLTVLLRFSACVHCRPTASACWATWTTTSTRSRVRLSTCLLHSPLHAPPPPPPLSTAPL